ncbi:hypothetical protein V496_04297 [Pseudogymnoascus sp. VKM F-4515 (FW-2607)]|nr:hypothetical protein V496_04297 [Pseudogymnoascus sp. VKM F-4515 (FW-2607)]KFZ00385.1 hypothetical protein V498_00104 [Pseudogymnoascus sp. VKM F-4517 (FW-2822)]
MPLSDIFFLAFALLPLAYADVRFDVPGPGGVVPAGTDFKVSWSDSDTAPSIDDLVDYSIALYSGSNEAPIPLLTLVPSGTFAENPNSASINIPITAGEPITNAYFLGIQSTTKSGEFITNYSSRFTVDSMTGKFPVTIRVALSTVSGTTGPQTETSNLRPRVAQAVPVPAAPAPAAPAPGVPAPAAPAPAAPAPAAPAGGDYSIPYSQQKGDTRYAPMQPKPPKAITATALKPLWPTSAVKIATTFLPAATVVTTITQSPTGTAVMHANTAAAQSQPDDDMQKYLRRWKD